jgi:hypothetical protein
VATTVTTTVRVIYGVHYHTANARANALTAITASRPNFYVLVLFVTHRTKGGHAL